MVATTEIWLVQGSKDASPKTLEARMRNTKFLAELTKFRLCPYGTFFTILKVRIDLTSIALRIRHDGSSSV